MNHYWTVTETNSPKLLGKPKALAKIESHLVENEKVLILIWSAGSGYLVATETRCLILKVSAWQSALAGSLGGGRVASFYYQDINGLEYNSGFVSGVLQIRTASYESSANKDFWKGTFSNRNADTNDPFTLSNTFPLPKPEYKKAKPLIDKIKRLISESKSQPSSQANGSTDVSEGLSRLAELRASGALSEEEFTLAKERLLGDSREI